MDRSVAILGDGTMGLLLFRVVVAHGAKRVVVTDRGPTDAAGPSGWALTFPRRSVRRSEPTTAAATRQYSITDEVILHGTV
jgi:hypothetical protein